MSEETIYTKFSWAPEVLAERGLPATDYPVPQDALKTILQSGGKIPDGHLLVWLMEYIAEHPEERSDYEGALFALMAKSAPLDDREAIEAESEDWWIEIGPVDLGADIITIQQNADLIAAICRRPDGTLRTALFRPPNAKVVEYLLSLAAKPGPNGLVNLRENNWELDLDASAGMGNVYADQAGQAYLSRWEYGLGVSALGEPVAPWYDQRSITPIPAALVVGTVGTSTPFKTGLK